jgi:predicted DNA binding CopG/RHH family protein
VRKKYDFTTARKNSCAAQLKKPVTIRLNQDALTYLKSLADETGIPHQSLINLYLRDCAASKKKINLAWR